MASFWDKHFDEVNMSNQANEIKEEFKKLKEQERGAAVLKIQEALDSYMTNRGIGIHEIPLTELIPSYSVKPK